MLNEDSRKVFSSVFAAVFIYLRYKVSIFKYMEEIMHNVLNKQ